MKRVTVYEKYSRHWPAIAIVSATLSIIIYGAYLFSDHVLLEGYLRLTAFIFFALSLLSFFKWKDGRMSITLTLTEGQLLQIRYLVRGKPVAEESFDLNDFNEIKLDAMPDKTIYNDFATGDHALRLQRKDNGEWIYLTEVHGRVIPLDSENADQLKGFLELHATWGDVASGTQETGHSGSR